MFDFFSIAKFIRINYGSPPKLRRYGGLKLVVTILMAAANKLKIRRRDFDVSLNPGFAV